MWLYDICHPAVRQVSYKRMTNVTQSQERLPCIVIIASLHHISCVIVIIHLTLANSQGEVCDEEEAIYYTFGPGKAQKVTDVIKKKSPETS